MRVWLAGAGGWGGSPPADCGGLCSVPEVMAPLQTFLGSKSGVS